MVETYAIEAVLQSQHTLDFVSLNERRKDIPNGQGLTTRGNRLTGEPVRSRQDATQAI